MKLLNASLDQNISEITCLAFEIDPNTGDQTCSPCPKSFSFDRCSPSVPPNPRMPPLRTHDTHPEASTSAKQHKQTKNRPKRRNPQPNEQSTTPGVSKIKASLRQTRRFLAKVNLLGLMQRTIILIYCVCNRIKSQQMSE